MSEVREQVIGFGSLFFRWNSAAIPAAWQEITQIKSFDGPTPTRDTVEATHMKSTDRFRERVSGLRDGGTFSMELIYDRVGYTLVRTDYLSNSRQFYKIELSDTAGTTLEFGGFITEMPLTVPLEELITFSVTIQITGRVAIYDRAVTAPPAP